MTSGNRGFGLSGKEGAKGRESGTGSMSAAPAALTCV